MGGAGFPTHKKYETDKEISTLLINGVECEPFLTCDYRLMLEKSFALLNGVALLFKASGAKEAVICIEDNKPEAIRILKELLVQAGTMSVSYTHLNGRCNRTGTSTDHAKRCHHAERTPEMD